MGILVGVKFRDERRGMTKMDFQRFYAGDEFGAYEYMGAHPEKGGYVFRVYGPAAKKISLLGEFSGWQEVPMQKIYDGQFYEVFMEGAEAGQMYKYRVYRQDGSFLDHGDPYAFRSEKRPGTASVIYDLSYDFQDEEWMGKRTPRRDEPLNIYEIHAGSWIRKKPWDKENDPAEGWLTYRELADRLIPYLLEHHYNAVELMPLAEYPADESWGYQETGFYSATSRYGQPRDLQYLTEQCHLHGISVILDVVTVHFAVNDYALWNFDGTALYEYPNSAVGYSQWGSCNFMHSRGDVCSFLQSACAFWLDRYHFDGLRFDAVGNLIYWQGSIGRGVNRDAVRFLQKMNRGLKERYPGAMLIAEDSTSYEGTTKPVSGGGLGFDYKWDLGWMNDTLKYMSGGDQVRRERLGELLFSMDYFYHENYLLPLSHDEVVHGKGAMVEKMQGDFALRITQAKLLYLYMYTHPGKKLNFMGNELALTREWDEKRQLDWESLEDPVHRDFQSYFDGLNQLYLEHPALWERDYEEEGFQWVIRGQDGQPLIAFIRAAEMERLMVVLNFSEGPVAFSQESLRHAKMIFDTGGVGGSDWGSWASVRAEGLQGMIFALDDDI